MKVLNVFLLTKTVDRIEGTRFLNNGTETELCDKKTVDFFSVQSSPIQFINLSVFLHTLSPRYSNI